MTISNDELFGVLFLVCVVLTVLAFACGWFAGQCHNHESAQKDQSP